jgi:hypothetical protein
MFRWPYMGMVFVVELCMQSYHVLGLESVHHQVGDNLVHLYKSFLPLNRYTSEKVFPLWFKLRIHQQCTMAKY